MQIPVPYGSMLHLPPTKQYVPAAKQEPRQTAYHLTKNIEDFLDKKKEKEKKSKENGPVGTKDKTGRAKGVDRRTREEIPKQNEMIAQRFETGGEGGGEGYIRQPRPPCGGEEEEDNRIFTSRQPHGVTGLGRRRMPQQRTRHLSVVMTTGVLPCSCTQYSTESRSSHLFSFFFYCFAFNVLSAASCQFTPELTTE